MLLRFGFVRRHVVGAACLLVALGSASVSAESVDPERFEKEVIASGLSDPMQLEVLDDGRIYLIEITGKLKFYNPETQTVEVIGHVPVACYREVGLMGLKLEPNFDQKQRLYLFYCPRNRRDHLRLSRFQLRENRLDLASEIVMFEYGIEPDSAAHMGGGMGMDLQGNLYIGTGDNCNPIPELPVDQRKGHEGLDALRSSGNTNDLRGKVLKIHPEEDGTYTIPDGNLFSDDARGRPEIYTMGCRNPFRIYVDPKTNWLYWGDVGPNVVLHLKIGPNGYDEINQARSAGNFGWPMFVGPNEAYRWWDFEKKQRGPWFKTDNPVNSSRNNTGARVLPTPQKAFIWYPTGQSEVFPELGSGGRAAMSGPIYHFDPTLDSRLKLPEILDGRLWIYDWTRNWIKTVVLDEQGGIDRIEPFLNHMIFRKPIDMKFRSDGTLYVIEYGDIWVGNTDAQIVRIVYRRGNRRPVAVLRADRTAGRQPLRVKLDGTASHDKDDGDPLQYAWRLATDPKTFSRESRAEITLDRPGLYRVQLTVRDGHGAPSNSDIEIRVGNAPPVVRILDPPHGGFFDWDEPIFYRIQVDDPEDGVINADLVDSSRVVVRAKYQQRLHSTLVDAKGKQLVIDDSIVEPGLAMMRKTTCFACHTSNAISAGPPYETVAKKYHKISKAHDMLAKKIISGGSGVWGAKPMPPHPQHTLAETRLMVNWILSLALEGSTPPMAGAERAFRARSHPDGRADAGVYIITAGYTDNGADGAPAITGEAVHVLHSRTKKAAFFDTRSGTDIVDEYEGELTIVGRFADGDYVSFTDVRLTGIGSVSFRAGALGDKGGSFELRSDGPDGMLLAQVDVPPSVGYRTKRVPITVPGGTHDLFVVASAEKGYAEKSLGLNWLIFHDTDKESQVRKQRQARALRLLELQKLAAQPRKFVRNWTAEDLVADLANVERNRSFENGKQVFQLATCVNCHRMGNSGGKLGPELTDVATRMAKRQNPRLSLLEELLHPSRVVADEYKTHVITTDEGRQLSGVIVHQDEATVHLVSNPLAPDVVTELARDQIDAMQPSKLSVMPEGLLSTFTRDDIFDLLAYLEAGANNQHPRFAKDSINATNNKETAE